MTTGTTKTTEPSAYRKYLMEGLNKIYLKGWGPGQCFLTADEAECILRTITELKNTDETPRTL